VTLQVPIFHTVTAIVYFTPERNRDQTPRLIHTHSVTSNATLLVFQLEPHKIPDKFQHQDFYVQVALRVDSVESAMVPDTLELASIANLDEPTDTDCSQQETHHLAIIVGPTGVVLTIVAICVTVCSVLSIRNCQRTLRQKNISAEERAEFLAERRRLEELFLNATGKNRQYLLHQIRQINGFIRGDGEDE
jgi:hypothetical protein